ncbi:MAG: aldose epimerase family protein [Liquorilactobacillus hordei]|mgnify:FL=1|uniref:aldose epimerase family protein n=1 Tax=Liquorilactobacillus hordei TaxID=468911 RepID=UPI0039E906AF
MKVEQMIVSKYRGENVSKYRIKNKQGNYIDVMTQGATWLAFVADGTNLLAHFDTVEEYYNAPTYLCKSIGRVAGRIGNSQVEIDGVMHKLPQNEDDKTLHGGPNGFSDYNWAATILENKDESKVVFTKKITEEKDGFPGNLEAKIEYSFDENNQVKIKFSAKADGSGIFNPTNHVYFNLSDQQVNLTKHVLEINGSSRLELNQAKLPTGKFLENTQTGYDFEHGNLIVDALEKIKHEFGASELDDVFVVKGGTIKPIGKLSNLKNHKQIEIYSTRPGLVVYTTDIFNQGDEFNAIALEAQGLPDFMHHPEWKDNYYIEDGTEKSYEIRYQYSIAK